MRGATHLKAVRESGDKGSIPTTTEHVPETRGNWLETARIPSLIDDMERMMNEVFHRPLSGFGMTPWRGLLGELGKGGGMSPAVDIFEDDGKIVVKADLPGLTKNDVEVKLVENILEITGEKKTEEKVDRRDYLKLERSYGKFSRTIRLPEGLDTDHVTAGFTAGVLEVTIPRIAGKRTVQHITIK